jgi:hypothetical protein
MGMGKQAGNAFAFKGMKGQRGDSGRESENEEESAVSSKGKAERRSVGRKERGSWPYARNPCRQV